MDKREVDALFADMARLGARPYAEVGVPMYLLAEDRREAAAAPAPETGWPAIAERFAQIGAALAAERPGWGEAELARVIEVLADQTILDGLAFTALDEDR